MTELLPLVKLPIHAQSSFLFIAPALKNQTPIGFFKFWGGRLLSNFLPKTLFATGLYLENISRIPEVVSEYQNDPIAIHKISLETAFDTLTIGREICSMPSPMIATSFMIAHGDADVITSYEESVLFYNKLETIGKKEHLWVNGGFHERKFKTSTTI